MATITEKELSALGDLLTLETTLCKKCQALAASTSDATLSHCYRQMAGRHQNHIDELYKNLK